MVFFFIEFIIYSIFNFSTQLHYDEVNAGLNAIRKNYAWGLLYFPNNYTTSTVARFNDASTTSNVDIELSTVPVWIDNSSE